MIPYSYRHINPGELLQCLTEKLKIFLQFSGFRLSFDVSLIIAGYK